LVKRLWHLPAFCRVRVDGVHGIVRKSKSSSGMKSRDPKSGSPAESHPTRHTVSNPIEIRSSFTLTTENEDARQGSERSAGFLTGRGKAKYQESNWLHYAVHRDFRIENSSLCLPAPTKHAVTTLSSVVEEYRKLISMRNSCLSAQST